MTTQGFYSVVAHRKRPDHLVVGARTREDLNALDEQIRDLRPFEDPSADYRWRAVVSRDDCGRALGHLAEAAHYDDFKAAVRAGQGSEREQVYHDV